MKKYTIGITGASGSIYAKILIKELVKLKYPINIVITDNGKKVFEYETLTSFSDFLNSLPDSKTLISLYENDDMFAPIASGSYPVEGMVIVPCTMTTIGKIAGGIGDNLLIRAADVCLKERRKLIVVPRESPLSSIHLKNMLTLSEGGGLILPPMPGFYFRPTKIDDLVNHIVGRIMESMGIQNSLYQKWSGGNINEEIL